MNAVGIDVSKGKSMVAALQPGGKLLAPLRGAPHQERYQGTHFLCP